MVSKFKRVCTASSMASPEPWGKLREVLHLVAEEGRPGRSSAAAPAFCFQEISWPLWPPGQSHSCTPSPKSHSPIGKGDAEPWEILSPEVLKMYSSQPGKGGNRLATGKCFIGIICLWFDFQINLEIYHSTTNPPEINPHINSINTKNRDVPHPLLHMVCWAH